MIERVRRDSEERPSPRVALGIGDDCAILRPRAGDEIVVTTDLCLEGRHFRRDWHSPESAGHRCLARGLSDIAAMGATPMAAFLSLALPPKTPPAWVTRFFAGLRWLADRYAVPLAGGDTAQAPDGLIVADIVLIGSVPRGRALRRSGARPGDRLYVSGALGGAAAELERMSAGALRPARSANAQRHPQMFPEPRIALGKALRRYGATTCIDLSDGLSTEVAHLCRESKVGAEVLAEAIPIHHTATLGQALNGGEDYELLFTVPHHTRMPKKIAGVPLTPIGTILDPGSGIHLVDGAGKRRRLVPKGWEHFRS